MKNIKSFCMGAICMLLLLSFGTTAYAAVTGNTIDIISGIKLFLYGEQLEMKDARGNEVEPFIYNGTTYVPVRALSEALGYSVAWDSENKSVYIDEPLSSEARFGVSKIIVRHWYFGKIITAFTMDFQACQLTTEGYDWLIFDAHYTASYIPSERHADFFEAVEQYGFLNWNSLDWKWHNTWDDSPSDDGLVAVPPEDGISYDISVVFDNGTEWTKYAYESFPDSWNEMREAFIELTGKDVLLYPGTTIS